MDRHGQFGGRGGIEVQGHPDLRVTRNGSVGKPAKPRSSNLRVCGFDSHPNYMDYYYDINGSPITLEWWAILYEDFDYFFGGCAGRA